MEYSVWLHALFVPWTSLLSVDIRQQHTKTASYFLHYTTSAELMQVSLKKTTPECRKNPYFRHCEKFVRKYLKNLKFPLDFLVKI
jgi:hypothetical protein